jgi:hypothetical protein
MKKFLGKVIKHPVLPKRYLAEGLENQAEHNKRKELPPKLIELYPVWGRQVAAEQEAFRNKKRGSTGLGCFSA